jgi:hypothetical protein
MKAWIGAAALAVLMAGGAAAIGPATATANGAVRTQSTEIADSASPRRARRHHRQSYRSSHRAIFSGSPPYLGRPVYYAPAPFPLGFDFGFGWW